MKKIKYFTLVGLLVSTLINAEECSDVIALSANISYSVENQDYFEQTASAFCDEYSRSANSRNKSRFDLATQYFVSTFKSSRAKASSLASKICSSSNTAKANNSAYVNYVKNISPDAYSAYKSCIEFSGNGIKLSVDKNTILPKEFIMWAKYTSQAEEAKTTFQYSASEGVTCHWVGQSKKSKKSTSITVSQGKNLSLKCERSDISKDSFVQLIPASFSGANPYTFKWGRYNQEGESISGLKELHEELRSSVLAFDLEECPDGWDEYGEAYGLFVR